LLADHSGRKTLLFGVLHHHIVSVTRVDIPDGKTPVSLTLDAGELIEGFCKSHVGYILHGHQHVPFVGTVSRMNISNPDFKTWDASKGNLFVLGSGTTGAKREWLSNEFQKNAFSIYVPRDNHLDVSIFQFSPNEGASLYWKGAIPLQDFHEMAAR
jgi:hypothetical protein